MLLGVFLGASRCLPVHREGQPGHRLQSCPGKAGKEQEKLSITIPVITIFDEKTLAHDVITGAESPSAPVPSGVTPLCTEQSTLALGGPRLCTHTRHRASLAGAETLPGERAAALGQRPGSPQGPKLTRRRDAGCVPGPTQEPAAAERAVSLRGRDWAQSSSQRDSGNPQPALPLRGSPPPPAAGPSP